MIDQRQHENEFDSLLRPRPGSDNAQAGTNRLAAARQEAAELFAATDAILDRFTQTNSTRILPYMRQSGGQ